MRVLILPILNRSFATTDRVGHVTKPGSCISLYQDPAKIFGAQIPLELSNR
jgi:hypothetical protein